MSVVPSPTAGLFQAYQANKHGPPPAVTATGATSAAPDSLSAPITGTSASSNVMRPRPQFHYSLSLPLAPANDSAADDEAPLHPLSVALSLPQRQRTVVVPPLDSLPPVPRLPSDFRAEFTFSFADVRGLALRYLSALSARSVVGWMSLWADDPAPSNKGQPRGSLTDSDEEPDSAALLAGEPSLPVEFFSPSVRRRWSIRDGHLAGRMALRKHADKELTQTPQHPLQSAQSHPTAATEHATAVDNACRFVALLAGASERQWTLLYTRPTVTAAAAFHSQPAGTAITLAADVSSSRVDAASAAHAAATSSSAQLISEQWELNALGKLRCVRVFEAETQATAPCDAR